MDISFTPNDIVSVIDLQGHAPTDSSTKRYDSLIYFESHSAMIVGSRLTSLLHWQADPFYWQWYPFDSFSDNKTVQRQIRAAQCTASLEWRTPAKNSGAQSKLSKTPNPVKRLLLLVLLKPLTIHSEFCTYTIQTSGRATPLWVPNLGSIICHKALIASPSLL